MAGTARNASARSTKKAIVLAAALIAVLAIAGGVFLLQRDDSAIDAKALAREIGLPPKHDCGKDTETFRPGRNAEKATVFVPSTSWHWTRRCLDDLLEVALASDEDAPIQAFMERQVLRVLDRPLIRFHKPGDDRQWRLKELADPEDGSLSFAGVDRLAIVNRHKVAHNSLAQSLVGGWFLKAAQVLGEKGRRPDLVATYQALGLAAFDVILDPVSDRGLAASHPCELRPDATCTWYHAVTKRSAEASDEGATLNKHLIAISRLAAAADALTAVDAASGTSDHAAAAQRLRDAARAGLYQLVYAEGHVAAGKPPRLADYIAREAGGRPILRSWLYYGMNPSVDRTGYFLTKNPFKNCHYHLVDIHALGDAIRSVGPDADLGGFREPHPEFDGSIVDFIVRTLRTKQAEGMFADAATTPPGNWAGCREEMYSAKAADKAVAALLAAVEP